MGMLHFLFGYLLSVYDIYAVRQTLGGVGYRHVGGKAANGSSVERRDEGRWERGGGIVADWCADC